MRDIAGQVAELIADLVEADGFELVHVEYLPFGGTPILRVYIDQENGVTISDCAQLSKKASVLLDVEDLIASNYVLEISSPGLDRPLFKEADYERFTGEEIRLSTIVKIENRRNFKGTIEDFSNGLLSLNCAGQKFTIPFEKIKKARLVYRFD
jgi:ribosome maturation factor RimP